MAIIKLKRLTLENFKGVKNFTLEPSQDGQTSIYGANATGKSTLLDSWVWLLFGKNGENKADFDVKPIRPGGTPVHGIESSVEAVLDIDGEELILKKAYKGKYTRKRGSTSDELTGHTVDYWIDGVPVKQREYQDRIAGMADEELFRLLSDVRYFNDSLHWQKRRQMLLTVCGDTSDAEIISAVPQLHRLPSVLGKRSVGEYRKIASSKKADINKQIEQIPSRIDEANKVKVDVGEATKVGVTEEIVSLQSQAKTLQAELDRIESGGEVAEKTKLLRKIEGELLAIENNEKQESYLLIEKKRLELDELQKQRFFIEQKERERNQRIEDASKEVERLKKENDQLTADWYKANRELFSYEQESVCPTCGQNLPESQLEAARVKAQANFNAIKSARLEKINAQGKTNKGKIQLLLDAVKIDTEAGTEALEELKAVVGRIQAFNAEIDYISKNPAPPQENPEKEKLQAEKQAIEKTIVELQAGSTESTGPIREQISAICAKIAEKQAILAQICGNYRAEARIRELTKLERDLAKEFEELEGNLFMTEQFIRAKVSSLNDRINSKFSYVSVKLFDQQINGGLQEVCETCVGGIPYRSMNEAARINAGIEIANVLSDHHELVLPCFVDGAESVCELMPSRGQQIRLVVSENHPTLTVGE